MTGFWQILTTGWNWEPSVLIGCAGLILAYLVVFKYRVRGKWPWFGAAVVLLLLALISPLDALGDTYLFSAHMVQHLLLLLAVPLLLLAGLPVKQTRKYFKKWPFLIRSERLLSWPPLAWLVGIGTMWAWHWPAFYEAALENQSVHILEHLSFLFTGVLFWWPVRQPLPERRLPALPALAYLVTALLASLFLGIILTFASPSIYPAYMDPVDRYGLLGLLRDSWGLGRSLDQQLGGIIMWVLGSLFYLIVILSTIIRWFSESEENYREQEEVSPVPS